MTSRMKKIVTVLFLLVLFAIGFIFYVSHWIKLSLPEILNSNPDRTYDIRYGDYQYNWLESSLKIDRIVIKPMMDDLDNASLEGTIGFLEVNQVNLLGLLMEKKITAQQIHINAPEFYLVSQQNTHKAADQSQSLGLFWRDVYNSIEIKNVKLTNGSVVVFDKETLTQTFFSKAINIELQGVKIDTIQLANPLPFAYDRFKFDVGATEVQLGGLYKTTIQGFKADDNGLEVNGAEVLPCVSRKEFSKRVDYEQDYITCKTDHFSLKNTRWGFKNDTIRIEAKRLLVNQLDMNLYRNKSIKDGTKTKKLYSQLLRELPFYLTIDSLELKKGSIIYEEQKQNGSPIGKLSFNEMSLKGGGIDNFQYRKKNRETRFETSLLFYNSAKLNATLSFKIGDEKDRYQVNGRLSDFDVSSADQFVKPLMNIQVEGDVHQLDFAISGSNSDASADISFDYEKLKVIVLNKKTKKQSFFKTKAANLLIKSNQKRKTVNENVYVKRDTTKSMYYQIWQCIQAALKEVII